MKPQKEILNHKYTHLEFFEPYNLNCFITIGRKEEKELDHLLRSCGYDGEPFYLSDTSYAETIFLDSEKLLVITFNEDLLRTFTIPEKAELAAHEAFHAVIDLREAIRQHPESRPGEFEAYIIGEVVKVIMKRIEKLSPKKPKKKKKTS